PVPAPMIVDVRRQRLELTADVLREQVLHALVGGERDVRTFVEQPAARESVRRSVAAVVTVLVVHHRGRAVFEQPLRGAAARHAGSENRYWSRGGHLVT